MLRPYAVRDAICWGQFTPVKVRRSVNPSGVRRRALLSALKAPEALQYLHEVLLVYLECSGV